MDEEGLYNQMYPCARCGRLLVRAEQVLEDGDPFCWECSDEMYK